MEITCVDCGKKFENRNPNALRCKECKVVYRREYDRKMWQKRKERELELRRKELELFPDLANKNKHKQEAKEDRNDCKRKKECYYGAETGCLMICDYLGITGTRRPCSVEDCYMFKRRS